MVELVGSSPLEYLQSQKPVVWPVLFGIMLMARRDGILCHFRAPETKEVIWKQSWVGTAKTKQLWIFCGIKPADSLFWDLVVCEHLGDCRSQECLWETTTLWIIACLKIPKAILKGSFYYSHARLVKSLWMSTDNLWMGKRGSGQLLREEKSDHWTQETNHREYS